MQYESFHTGYNSPFYWIKEQNESKKQPSLKVFNISAVNGTNS
jgi:hypothetical protein